MSEQHAEAQTAPEQAPATTETPSGGLDASALDPITQRLDELSSQLGELQQPQEPFQGYQEPAYDPQYGMPGYQQQPDHFASVDAFGQPIQDPGEQQAMAQLQQLVQQQAQQIVGPVQQQFQQYVQHQQARELEQKYPDLQKGEVAGPIVEAAARLAQRLGNPSLASDPEVIENLYLAQVARQRASQETPVGGEQDVQLEGGGAAPEQPEPSVQERIINAGGGGGSGFAWT